MGQNRFVHLLFATAGLLAAVLAYKCADWVWGVFAKPSEWGLDGIALLVGVTTSFVLFKNRKVFDTATEIGAELKKVTWPTRKETYQQTVVVIITVVISALLLAAFDAIWSKLTGTIYG